MPPGCPAEATINNRNVISRRISSVRDNPGCQILFVAASESGRTREIPSYVQKSPVLTVSDMPNFTGDRGVIQFALKNNKVRFEVNLTAAKKTKLNFSSQLLKVATEIRQDGRNPEVRR